MIICYKHRGQNDGFASFFFMTKTGGKTNVLSICSKTIRVGMIIDTELVAWYVHLEFKMSFGLQFLGFLNLNMIHRRLFIIC
jgi:hypothetical protein